MKSFIILTLFAFVAIAYAEEHYTNKYDDINVDEILHNEKLLDSYIKCLLDLGPCTGEGRELKAHIREALENHCGRCTEKQKIWVRKVIAYLINHKVESWNKLVDKYDKDRKYSTKYEEELREVAKH